MCLLVVAWRSHPHFPLIVAANRDEFHERPAAPLDVWSAPARDAPTPRSAGETEPARSAGPPDVLGGRDLRAGGTWLALDRSRRFGVVTNYRDLQRAAAGAPSRGELIPDFLAQGGGAGEYMAALEPRADGYSGFNLLLADDRELWYASNRARPFARALPPGIYGLSNHLLDTPWPKLERVRRAFRAWLDSAPTPDPARLLEMLGDRTPASDDEELPETGLPAEWERILSSPFVRHPEYGTRCSTVVLRDADGALEVRERRFDVDGQVSGETAVSLDAGEWP